MGRAKIFPYRKTKILQYFFVCLFLILLSIEQLQAQVDPKLEAKIKDALSGKPWTIYLSYKELIRGKLKSQVEPDILTFTEYTVISENLFAQGYSKDGASYKVNIGPDQTYIWQAVMLHENQKDTVLLKGELKEGVMAGVIVYQLQDGTSRTGNFTTIPPE